MLETMKCGLAIQQDLLINEIMKKIKVAWVCSFSNEEMRAKLPFKNNIGLSIVFKLMGKKGIRNRDSAVWNSNAIEELEKINDVEMHIICPVRDLAKPVVTLTDKGIHYYFFREQNSNAIRFSFHQIFTRYTSRYKKNRRFIKQFIEDIKPDIVHVTGAENPYYSLSLLDVPSNIPTLIQLQTLLTRLYTVTKVKEEKKSFYLKGLIEREIIKRADYIAPMEDVIRQYIVDNIKPVARFVDIELAMAQKINLEPTEKLYDFVYFSANISKAGEEALESFIAAHRRNPNITLDIVGGYDSALKEKLDARIKECGVENCVTFEGLLPTHDDVIRQIRKSRFALLPLKMDILPNTIHEAMANGLPVVTTITEGTPSLNESRLSVLITEQNDFESMAENMIKLIDNKDFAKELCENAALTEEERSSNKAIIAKWVETYKAIVYQHAI